jgi:hypothetical protein
MAHVHSAATSKQEQGITAVTGNAGFSGRTSSSIVGSYKE